MKLLWLCNMAPGIVLGEKGNGLWMDHILSDLRQQDMDIHILFPGKGAQQGRVDGKCSYAAFSSGLPQDLLPEQVTFFEKALKDFCPDVVHIWGTEYAHTLAMVQACEKHGVLDKTVINLQGLCSVIARHYAEGVPHKVQRGFTIRDLVRRDNILLQQNKFFLRGQNEIEALRKIRHVIGRTHWDKACMEMINPQAKYHFCNETMREPFFEGQWSYESCQKHRVFASSCEYPVKGFHYLLEAFAQVCKTYPDATLAVPGYGFLRTDLKSRLRRSRYQKYLKDLVSAYHLEDRVEFLGYLNAEQMKQQYLSSNVFVLPSTIENSPNSLAEAMLLGVPCVASDVGGVSSMMEHRKTGFLYQSTAPYVLAHYIGEIFSMEDGAAQTGNAAHQAARKTHDPETNLKQLLEIYRELTDIS